MELIEPSASSINSNSSEFSFDMSPTSSTIATVSGPSAATPCFDPPSSLKLDQHSIHQLKISSTYPKGPGCDASGQARNFSSVSNFSMGSWDVNNSSPLAEIVKVYTASNSSLNEAPLATGAIPDTNTGKKPEKLSVDKFATQASSSIIASEVIEKKNDIYSDLYTPPPAHLQRYNLKLSLETQGKNVSPLAFSAVSQLTKLVQSHSNLTGVYLTPEWFVTPQIYDSDQGYQAMIWDGSVKVNIITELKSLLDGSILKITSKTDENVNKVKNVSGSLKYLQKLILAFGLLTAEKTVNSNQENVFSGVKFEETETTWVNTKGKANIISSTASELKKLSVTSPFKRNSLPVDSAKQGTSNHKHASSLSTILGNQSQQLGSYNPEHMTRSQRDRIAPIIYFTALTELLSSLQKIPQLHLESNKDIELILKFLLDVVLKFVWKDVLRCFKGWASRFVNDSLV